MKVNGQEVTVNEDILVIPRGSGEIVFRGRAIKDYDTFDKLRPAPRPPGIRTRDGFKPDLNDATYKQLMAAYGLAKVAYVVITTLEPSNIEWDTVKPDDPTTWNNWVDDMLNAGFSGAEQQRILNFVMEVNCLDEKKMEAARADFLAGQARA